ncbi:TonB-dependent receptor [Lacihabitans sp. LS3-19]|uniref:TonB-dependent receptor n=1 Tax=Lacihabitans sp. LS3-19 TaxID=2487335 RepID=UPI0020CF0859|nr:TonB-dependent receptor [Lacihabitans sp. LS3-19]MCP9768925.1 TonB-dependent receptor [Lacihabitans sp. LS3-19]
MGAKNTIAIVFFGLITLNSLAQNTISGSIKDTKTNEILAGANVYISDLKLGVSTNNEGFFKIENIKPGSYLFEISYLGYNNFVQKIYISKDTILNISLNSSVSELNEVVVTAVTRSTELKRSPVIIKAIDKNALNQNSSTNLIDALKNVPGVNQITTGASISKPIIRGLGYNRVITLYNGIRQEGQQWGDEHGIEIDEYDIDRIEIVKGPGSLMYGSDGIAGVLNFLSPKAPYLDETKSQLVTNYQSNNNLIGYSFSNSGNKKGFQWMGRFSNKYAGNYQNKYDGKVYNSGFKEYDGSLFLGINKNWGHSHLNLSTYNNTLNLVEGERDDDGNFLFITPDGNEQVATKNDLKGYKIGFPHQEVNHLRASLNNYFILKKGTLNADFAFQNNQRKEFGEATNPKDIELFFFLNTFNYNLRYNFSEKNGWETSFGIGGMYQTNQNKGLEVLIPEYGMFDAGAFLFTQKTFEKKLTLSGGIRFDNRTMNSKQLILDENGEPTNLQNPNNEVKFNAFKQNYNGISGSLGLAYLIDKTSTLKFNISRGFRAPTIAELASNGRHEGTFRYEIGNQNLKSEISQQIDIAYFYNSDHLTFELTPFANFISNYIYSEKMKDENGNDIIPDPSDPAPGFKFVQGNARLLGGEIYLDVHPHPLDWLHIGNSFSFVQATQANQTDSTKYLPFIPAPKYRGELKAQFKKTGKALSNAYMKFSLDHYFMQNKVFSAYETETATPSYTLLGLGMGGDVKGFNRKDFMSIFISADNLTDVAYQSHLSRLKYAPENPLTGRMGVFNMGRNISLKMIFNL